jgi:NAD-dependent aldehyde dehydrogenases
LRLGVNASGLWREGSKYGIEDYVEIKDLCMRVQLIFNLLI